MMEPSVCEAVVTLVCGCTGQPAIDASGLASKKEEVLFLACLEHESRAQPSY